MSNKEELNKRISELEKEIKVQLYYIRSWGSRDKIERLKEELKLLKEQV